MSKGGISPTRMVKGLLVDLPVRAARISLARNTAAATEEGQRLLALVGFGIWVTVFWLVAGWLHQATGMVAPLQIAGLFGLLLIWRIVGLLRRWWVNRRNLTGMAVSLQRQRQMYQMQAEALDQLRKIAAGAGRQVSEGGVDVLGIFRGPPHPAQAEQERTRREQARQVRDMLGDEHRDMPLGDRAEPVIPMPRWLRRRRPR
jgi:hypothetical protein